MRYPKWTNHFSCMFPANEDSHGAHSFIYTARSVIFNPSHYWNVVASDIGVLTALGLLWWACRHYSAWTVFVYYGIPWIQVNHWIVMITYLHHTDPVLPHYRDAVWSYHRGAAATLDRDFLGWQGRFFLYNGAYSCIGRKRAAC